MILNSAWIEFTLCLLHVCASQNLYFPLHFTIFFAIFFSYNQFFFCFFFHFFSFVSFPFTNLRCLFFLASRNTWSFLAIKEFMRRRCAEFWGSWRLNIKWQATLLSLLSFLICCQKLCDFFQMLIGQWLKESLKNSSKREPPRPKTKDFVLLQKTYYLSPQTLELVLPPTPKHWIPRHSHNHKQNFKDPSHLLSLLSDAFVVEHIFTNLQWTHPWCDVSIK